MGTFLSSKVFDGFSTVFRQWKAETTHCKYLHGYGVSFKLWFEGDLDERNWVWDFGGMKRAKTQIDGMSAKQWMDYMFDHTVVIAEDDPEIEIFKDMHMKGIIQLRPMSGPVGAERFAEYIYKKLDAFVQEETDGRVSIAKVEFFENKKNTAIYEED